MENPFLSFWMAGYECSDQLNCFGDRVDLLEATRHLDHIEEDYQLLGDLNIATVREGVQWSSVEKKPYTYNWSRVEKIIYAARKKNIQVLWDLCHFGYPDDLTPLHPHFCRRFTAFAQAFVEKYRSINPNGALIVTPVNEVNFISWLGGEKGDTSPYTRNYGWKVKYELMRAYIQAVKKMKNNDDQLLILTTEPLINIIPEDYNNADLVEATHRKNAEQFQMMDMLYGYLCPELGGDPGLADIVGCNYYPFNQWFYPSENQPGWRTSAGVKGYKSLTELCREVAERYGRPIVITETSSEGDDKCPWIRFITEECRQMINQEIELWGVCIYPVLNRPDWDFPARWHDSGIWRINNADPGRKVHEQYAGEIRECMDNIYIPGRIQKGN